MEHDDIIDEERPVHDGDEFSVKHPKMPIALRAKIFMPFDALTGFDDSIDSRSEVTVPPALLSEERKDELNRRFAELYRAFKELPRKLCERGGCLDASALYFERSREQEELRQDGMRGRYIWISGYVMDIDIDFRKIESVNFFL